MEKIKYAQKQLDPIELQELYWGQKLTLGEVASKLKTSRNTVTKYMRLFNIPIRTMAKVTQLAYDRGTLDHKGSKASKWRGGRSIDKRGYVTLFVEASDPLRIMCHKGGNHMAEHRLVMARHLGRPLMSYELVHHINGIKGDNHIENLLIYSASDHQQVERNCRGCPLKKQFKILNARIRELAKQSQQILHN